MRFSKLFVLVLSLISLTACGLGEVRERQAVLEKLCATNAPLEVVTNKLGRIPIYKRGSQDWTTVMNTHSRYEEPRYQRIADKMNRSESVGVTSTKSVLTYIFLDDRNRLVDFQVDSQ